MNYQLIHDSIIDRAKNRVLSKETYVEIHHILPKSMGGTDDKSNLVILTAKEHFIVHKLLVEIYPNSDSMKRAIWCMSNLNNSMGRNYRVSAMEYERFKILVAEVNSEMMSGEGNPMFGKNPYAVWVEKYGVEEADRLQKEKNERQSKTMKEKGITPQHMAKIIEANKNKIITDEFRQKISERVSGENNGMYGRTGELNPRYGISTYDTWVEKYGAEEADRLMSELSQKMSVINSGENNPMSGRNPHDVWVEKYGVEEADIRKKEMDKKRAKSGIGNKNAKRHKVLCKETNVVYETITEAAKAIGMKGVTLNAWLHNPHRNKTTLVLL